MPQALTTDEATPASLASVNSGRQEGYQSASVQAPASLDARVHDPSSTSIALPLEEPPLVPLPDRYASQRAAPPSSRRITSPGGGVQMTLEGGGSWSDLARQDATLPTDANALTDSKVEGSGGVFGFLSRKKGRGHSPKPKERGVLGKEGARVVIG